MGSSQGSANRGIDPAMYDDLIGGARTDLLALPDTSSSEKTTPNDSETFYENNGPFVINTDGTLSRIRNWKEMTTEERSRTKRVIAIRNKHRMELLKGETETPLADNVHEEGREMPIFGPEK